MEGHIHDFVVKLLYVSFLSETILKVTCPEHGVKHHGKSQA